eukprot:TRINITY_DN535_c1_g1_i1.p2 TRINITY_DN535_c1_g1~~TRINITY_DN535_c1_g1_i1.p2  ORF type:complete len:373 (-),score=142.02 TRINITY_DN535_c1_g1_i1:2168-3286(-)
MAVNPVVTAEAKRVVSIMEEMAHDLDVIALIPTPDTYDPAIFSYLPHDVQKELEEYITKEGQFQDMMTFYRDRPVAPQKPEVQDMVSEIQSRFRGLIRRLKEFPPPREDIFVQDGGFESFRRTVDELSEVTTEKLLTSAEELRTREEDLEETKARHRQTVGDLKAVRKELSLAESSRKKDTGQKDYEIQRLKSDIDDVTRGGKNAVSSLEADVQDRRAKLTSGFEESLKEMEAQCAKLTVELAKLREKNQALEHESLKKNMKFHSEVSAWIAKYDDSMISKTDELRLLEQENEKSREEVKRLQELLEDHNKTVALFQEEERQQREKISIPLKKEPEPVATTEGESGGETHAPKEEKTSKKKGSPKKKGKKKK